MHLLAPASAHLQVGPYTRNMGSVSAVDVALSPPHDRAQSRRTQLSVSFDSGALCSFLEKLLPLRMMSLLH